MLSCVVAKDDYYMRYACIAFVFSTITVDAAVHIFMITVIIYPMSFQPSTNLSYEF